MSDTTFIDDWVNLTRIKYRYSKFLVDYLFAYNHMITELNLPDALVVDDNLRRLHDKCTSKAAEIRNHISMMKEKFPDRCLETKYKKFIVETLSQLDNNKRYF